MNLKSLIATGLAVCSISALALPGPITFVDGAVSFGNTPAAGIFSDIYTFTVPDAFDITTGTVSSAVNGTKDVDFSAITIFGSDATSFSFAQALGDPNELWAISGVTLQAGVNYSLQVDGIQSANVASYSGQMTITAVPEPETYALMLAGLGAMAFVARRRRPL